MRRVATVISTAPAVMATKLATRTPRPAMPILPGSADWRGSKFSTTQPMALGMRLRMPAVRMIETPLPMPYLSICSPSHIRNRLPAVSVVMPTTKKIVVCGALCRNIGWTRLLERR